MLSDAAVAAIQAGVKAEEIVIGEMSYLTRQVYLPPCEPMPGSVVMHTLTGIIEFINSVADKAKISAIHVASCNVVDAIGHLQGRHQGRATYAMAQVKNESRFRFDHFMPLEEFIIGLMTGFVRSASCEQVLAILGNIKDEAVSQYGDDGVSQSVVTKQGISMGQTTPVPNPVMLAPYRTFPEIAQPESPFVLRLKKQEKAMPLAALYATADQGWELEAIQSIRLFLADAIKDIPIIA